MRRLSEDAGLGCGRFELENGCLNTGMPLGWVERLENLENAGDNAYNASFVSGS